MHKDQPNESYFQSLLTRYREGNLLPEEKEFLEKYYALYENKEDLIQAHNKHQFEAIKNNLKARIDQEIQKEKKQLTRKRWSSFKHYPYAVAAILLISVCLGVYFAGTFQPLSEQSNAGKLSDIAPGTNRATLSLGGRATIDLSGDDAAELLQEEGIQIGKTSDGRIQYISTPTNQGAEPEHHTIITPRAGQYEVILSDGSSVFLNAGSSLRFPSFFQGKERVVELEGEAYFEVQGNKAMPFIVKSGIQRVEVTGTRFAINAYGEETGIQTTLLEGSVDVLLESDAPGSASNMRVRLSPGEQATVRQGPHGGIRKTSVNVHKATAWKDGLFAFENDDLKTIMRQIARWYDLEIIYEGRIPEEKFFGEIARESQLSEVLTILEYNNILFRLEDRKLYVRANPNTH